MGLCTRVFVHGPQKDSQYFSFIFDYVCVFYNVKSGDSRPDLWNFWFGLYVSLCILLDRRRHWPKKVSLIHTLVNVSKRNDTSYGCTLIWSEVSKSILTCKPIRCQTQLHDDTCKIMYGKPFVYSRKDNLSMNPQPRRPSIPYVYKSYLSVTVWQKVSPT